MNPVQKLIRMSLLAAAFASVLAAQPVILGVLNGASYSAAVSPGSLITVLGSNLAASSATAASVPLPTQLGGVSVSVGGVAAPLVSVSPSQVNMLIPFGVTIPSNTVVPLALTSSNGTTTYNIRLTRDAPAIFTQDGSGSGPALIFDGSFNPLDTVRPQSVVILYATGLGPVDSSGRVTDNVDVYLGERKAQVLYAGLIPQSAGVYQINAIAPALATDRLYLRAGGRQSNIVSVGIASGTNTANVRGTLDALYPTSDPLFTLPPCTSEESLNPCGPGESFSIMLHAGTFTVSFDIAPAAVPFDIAAVGEAGAAIISIDPKAGTWSATVNTLTAAQRAGDFSASVVPLWDYASCGSDGVCFPFPGPSLIPLSRIDPFWARAMQMLPNPTAIVPGTPYAIFESSTSIAGSHFAIDAQNNTNLSRFGGIVQVPLGPFASTSSTFKLYVDGNVIAQKNIPYALAHRCFATAQFCWGLP